MPPRNGAHHRVARRPGHHVRAPCRWLTLAPHGLVTGTAADALRRDRVFDRDCDISIAQW